MKSGFKTVIMVAVAMAIQTSATMASAKIKIKSNERETPLYSCNNMKSGVGFQISVVDKLDKKTGQVKVDSEGESRGYYHLSIFKNNGGTFFRDTKLYNLSLGALGDDATMGAYKNADAKGEELILHRGGIHTAFSEYLYGKPDHVDIRVNYKTGLIDKINIAQVGKDGSFVRIPEKGETRSAISCIDLRTGRSVDPVTPGAAVAAPAAPAAPSSAPADQQDYYSPSRSIRTM